MASFSQFSPVLKKVLTRIGGGQTTAEWAARPKGFMSPTAKFDLTLDPVASALIEDDIDTEVLSEDAGTLKTFSETRKAYSIQVKIESIEETDSLASWETAEKIRDALKRESVREELAKSRISVIGAGDITGLPRVRADGRQISGVVFFLNIEVVSREEITVDEPAGFIKTIAVTSHITTADGTEPSGNFTNETMPGA